MTGTGDGPRAALLRVLRGRIDLLAPAEVARFLRRVSSIPERQMRALALVRRLRRTEEHLCFALLQGLVLLSVHRRGTAQETLVDLTTARPLALALGAELSGRVRALARARGRAEVGRLLLSPGEAEDREVDESFLARQNDKLPDESLGWRKTLARCTDRLKLDRLLFDRHPHVVRLLLDNPRIVERDVVRIAAMRPTNPDNLVEVFRHPRWIRRYRVKTALACNPWTPLDIALACLPQLMRPQLQYVAATGSLHADLRQAAADLLRVRREPLEAPPEAILVVSEGDEIVPAQPEPCEGDEFDIGQAARDLEEWSAR